MASYFLTNGLQFLLDAAVKSAILMLAAWLLVIALRGASAAARHWAWSIALVSLLALPALSLILPSWRVELLPSLASKAGNALVEQVDETQPPFPAALAGTTTNSSAASTRALPLALGPMPAALARSSPTQSVDDARPISLPSLLQAFDWATAALLFWGIGALLVMAICKTHQVAGSYLSGLR